MGLRDWLGKQVGASGYGNAIGESVIENGLAVGRTIFLGHGLRPGWPDHSRIFDDGAQMEGEGFQPYCKDPLNRPPLEDKSELSKQSRALGIALASRIGMAATKNFFRDSARREEFNRSLGQRVRDTLGTHSSDFSFEEVLRYVKIPTDVRVALNLENPGTDDLLGVFLEELGNHGGVNTVGFQRGGVLGFDAIVVPLAQETVINIQAAAQKFSW